MKLWNILALIVASFLVGMSVGYEIGFPRNIWDSERNGLYDLNEKMKDDKSVRIALMVLTETGKVYSTQSVSGYKFTVITEKNE